MGKDNFQKEMPDERGLDSVARFFLSDRHAQDVPQRETGRGEGSVKWDEVDTTPDTRSGVCLVLCPDGFTTQASFLGCMLAVSLAASDIPVGLIETTARLSHAFFLSGGYENLDAVFWESDLNAPDFSNVLARFRKANDFVLINVAASTLSKTGDPAVLNGRYLVPATVRPQDLLNTYRTLKRASGRFGMAEIELVVIKHRSTDNAKGAAAVLEKMAHRFLSCSVRFIGAVTLPEDLDMPATDSSSLSLRNRPDLDASAVKEIARHFILSGGLREKGVAYVEKRL